MQLTYYCSELNTGLEFDLVCRLELDPAVDSELEVTSSWSRDGISLSPDGSRLTISAPVRVQQRPQVFESVVFFRTITTGDTGNYNCSLIIEAVNDMFITGTNTTVNRELTVEGVSVAWNVLESALL